MPEQQPASGQPPVRGSPSLLGPGRSSAEWTPGRLVWQQMRGRKCLCGKGEETVGSSREAQPLGKGGGAGGEGRAGRTVRSVEPALAGLTGVRGPWRPSRGAWCWIRKAALSPVHSVEQEIRVGCFRSLAPFREVSNGFISFIHSFG